MELQTALQLVNSIVLTKTGRSLREPEVVLFEGTWLGLTYEQIAESSEYSTNYLMRDVGPRFWRLLSDAMGGPVSKTNIRAVLEQVEQSTSPPPTSHLAVASESSESIGSSPRSSVFPGSASGLPKPPLSTVESKPLQSGDTPKPILLQGRTAELGTLTRWVGEEKCPLVGIWGVGGIGKTALVRTLVDQIGDRFNGVIWQSLNQTLTLPDLIQSLTELLPRTTTNAQTPASNLTAAFLADLQNSSCLIVLDNVEAVLQPEQTAGRYRAGYENYGEFFRSLGEHPHRSCVIAIGLEPLREFARLESETSTVRSMVLSGLSVEEARPILEEEKLGRSSQWATLIDYYRGHPAALRRATRIIRDLFGGSVDEFLRQQSFLFEDINSLLEKSFNRLSIVEGEILYWLASEDKPTTLSTIQNLIPLSIYPMELLEALDSLKQRSLLEITYSGDQSLFALQPLIRDYAINHLMAQVLNSAPVQERYQRRRSPSMGYPLSLTPSSSAPKVVTLTDWLNHRFDVDWQPVEILFAHPVKASHRLRSAFHLRGENMVKRFKQIKLRTAQQIMLVVLLVAINQEADGAINVCVQVQPNQGESLLPEHLKLSLLDTSSTLLAEVESQAEDNFIQLPYFRGIPQESFNIQLSLNAASHTEKFII